MTSESHHSEPPPADEGNHKFCFIDWALDGGNTFLYYLDTPYALGAFPQANLQLKGELRDFVNQLKSQGWQQYMSQADQSGTRVGLMRPPTFEKGYEYCVLSCEITVDGSQPAKRHSDFRLGERNEKLLPLELWRLTYDEIVQHLQKEQWEFVHKEEYLMHETLLQNKRLQLNFYKRPIP